MVCRTLVLVSFLLTAGAAPAVAGELIMLERAGCAWCRTWHEEVGAIYHKTPEGRAAPLRRVDIHDGLPQDLQGVRVDNFTPTFILMDDGREVGRIRGYPGQAFFWGLLGELVKRIATQAAPST